MRLIDADALKEQFKDRSLEDFTHLHFIEAIDNAPTIDSLDLDVHIGGRCCGKRQKLLDELRPKGKWGYTTHYARPYKVCPCCHAERLDDKSTGWNFCPNCGAQMER